ncbi:MAG: hypothetical protein HOL98_07070 [Gammaproteobacteria bacterium]|jgi:hypothetical protein|nr:hypothetical protein [Gammaproteobacteria bacterium]MBT5203199.1 hypothetical protein [Gammaproteobacteria bacterium]MBT6247277.1 hypothetical protein [Gammaproteobacteria bacterium]
MKIKSIFILLLLSWTTSHLNAEIFTYPIEEVEVLEIVGGIELYLLCGTDASLRVTAHAEDNFTFSQIDKTLKIASRQEGFWGLFSSGLETISVEMNAIRPPETITVSAGSEIGVSNCYSEDEANLDLVVKAGSLFTIEGNAGSIDQLDINLSSGSQIEIADTFHINHLNLEASSGADLEASKSVLINTAYVSISSGASAELCGALAISGKASSGGEVDVSETTKLTDIRTNSGGSIEPNC